MKRRLKIVLLLSTVILAAVLALVFWPPEEPSYRGRTLSKWVIQYGASFSLFPPAPATSRQEATEAIQHIGTNAVSYLLDWIQYVEPSGKNERLIALNNILRKINIDSVVGDEEQQRAECAKLAFVALGPDANAALPKLVALLNDPKSDQIGDRAAHALATLGESGLPLLIAALTNQNATVRSRAALKMEHLGTKAYPAIPALIRTLKDDDRTVAWAASFTLSRLRLEPNIVVPALMDHLQSSKPRYRIDAANSLARFAQDARPAVPALIIALKDPDPKVQEAASNALLRIDPEALKRATQP